MSYFVEKCFTGWLYYLGACLDAGVPWEGGCALCGALIGIGRTLTTLEATLIVHAIGAPLIFGGLALVYFRRFRYTTPLQIAIIFVVVVMLRDGTVVADLLEGPI